MPTFFFVVNSYSLGVSLLAYLPNFCFVFKSLSSKVNADSDINAMSVITLIADLRAAENNNSPNFYNTPAHKEKKKNLYSYRKIYEIWHTITTNKSYCSVLLNKQQYLNDQVSVVWWIAPGATYSPGNEAASHVIPLETLS